MPKDVAASEVVRSFARIREAAAPAEGDPDAFPEVCEDCGDTFWRWKGRRRRYCANCAAEGVIATAEANSNRAGPAYEKVVLGQLRHWHREAGRLGLLEPPCDCNDCPL